MSFVSCPEKNRNKRSDQQFLVEDSRMARKFRFYAYKNKTVNFLSLPAKDWTFEEYIVERFPDTKFCFWGCERDPIEHAFAGVRAEEFNNKYHGRATFQMTLNPGKLYKALTRHKQTGIPEDHEFDVIYADYCGYLHSSVMDDINAILSNPKNNGPSQVFALTIGLNTRNRIDYAQEMISKWESSLNFKGIEVNDERQDIKLDKGTYSEMPVELLKALACEIQHRAENNQNNKAGFLKVRTPHIYYSNNKPYGTIACDRAF
jgi:hypothetical protein